MIKLTPYEPRGPLIAERAADARLFGFRRLARRPPAVVLPVLVAEGHSDVCMLLYQQGTSEGRIRNFIADPDLREAHLIKSLAEDVVTVRVGELMILAYEWDDNKVVVAAGDAFRERMHALMISNIFDNRPFAGLEVAQFTSDLALEKIFAIRCTRDLMQRSRQLASSWIEGENLSPDAKDAARTIFEGVVPIANVRRRSSRKDLLSLDQLSKINVNHDRWADIWLKAWSNDRNDVVKGLGLRWLSEASTNHGGWATVWLKLWRDAMHASQDKIILVDLGCHWLATANPENARWASIWRRMWRSHTTPNDRLVELADRAIRWLPLVSPADRSWSSVWRVLWDKKADVVENRLSLVELAGAWLVETPPDHTGWAAVWRRLYAWAAPMGRTDVVKIALTWLGRVDPKHDSWYIVWCSLWNRESALQQELAIVAMAWLEQGDSRRGWPLVWKNLSEVTETNPELRNEIFELALRWLDRTRVEKIPGTSLTRPLIVEALRNSSPAERSK